MNRLLALIAQARLWAIREELRAALHAKRTRH
jgi:hypothetical protein